MKSYKYWPVDLVSAAFLIEPFACEALSILLGQDEIPGLQTLIGLLIISCGILGAVYGSKLKATQKLQFNKEKELIFNEMSEFMDHSACKYDL